MESLSHRERFLRTLRYQPVDRVPDLEAGPWLQTIVRWHQEGLPVEPNEWPYWPKDYQALLRYIDTDDAEWGPVVPVDVGLRPAFQYEVLEERGTHRIVRDLDGAIAEELRPDLGASIPHYIRYCIESRADWERLRDERLNPDSPGRVPENLDHLVRELNQADYPVILGRPALYGCIRNWMGVERLSVMLYDDRQWIEEMMEHLTRLILSVLERLAGRGLRVDMMDWWEDMCYNHGSLMSPRLFAELMLPRYRRVTGFLRREMGCEFHQLDCDGNVHELAPLWLEAGINILYPLEVAATDAHRLAAECGRQIRLHGGFDKRALAAGPAAVDAEFERLRPLLERGGYLPATDHMVPPDVSLAAFMDYRRRKCEFIGKPWREPKERA